MTVRTDAGVWVVPPMRAVWVAAFVEHSIQMTGSVAMRTLYINPELSPSMQSTCCVIGVSPLLRELIVEMVSIGVLYESDPSHHKRLDLLLDMLAILPQRPLALTMPTDPRARVIADRVWRNPKSFSTLTELAQGSGASIRTIERAFLRETGLTIGRWRQQVRLFEALRLLGKDMPVTTVAQEVGYESPSAFVAMFRKAFGTTPSRYFELDLPRNEASSFISTCSNDPC